MGAANIPKKYKVHRMWYKLLLATRKQHQIMRRGTISLPGIKLCVIEIAVEVQDMQCTKHGSCDIHEVTHVVLF